MPAATLFRYFSPLVFVLLAAAGLLSSCQSSRASLFQPIVLRAAAPHPVATAAPTHSTAAEAISVTSEGQGMAAQPANENAQATTAPHPAAVTEATADAPALARAVRPVAIASNVTSVAQKAAAAQARGSQPQAAQVGAAAWSAAASAATPTAGLKRQLAAHHYARLLHRAHAPAESGLGLTVLGLLAMVALVVALIGLAISGGGLGWIIAAGVAALVILVAYLDPGGH